MNYPPIKNVVFDIGNVLVKWSPAEIVARTFGDERDVLDLAQGIFQHELWRQLNRGELTEEEVKQEYRQLFGFDQDQVDLLFYHIKDTQELVAGTIDLIKRLHHSGYPLFALTDNVKEIVAYLQSRYTFWQYFQGIIVSAEVGCLKPDAEIFHHLLDQYRLEDSETLFIDDVLRNVIGAREVGLVGVQFLNAKQCERDLIALGIQF